MIYHDIIILWSGWFGTHATELHQMESWFAFCHFISIQLISHFHPYFHSHQPNMDRIHVKSSYFIPSSNQGQTNMERNYKHLIATSSTAQGGGGSFKNRKPIGEVGCCESGMAERIHWWTERCLRSPLFCSLSLTIYLPTYLPIYLLSIYLSIYLSLFFI